MTLRYLLGVDDFPARWHCGNWSELLGWTHVVADLATWAAYFAIPVVLFYFGRKRRDIPFRHLLPVFGLFILACGTGHLIDAIIFWYPIYRVSAVCKLITALVSWTAVFALFRVVPAVLDYPSPDEMKREIQRRRVIEIELKANSQRLELANQALEDFASTASHDLKSPVRAVRNLAIFLLDDNEELLGEASKDDLKMIVKRAGQMTELIDSLVVYSRLGLARETVSRINTRQTIESIVELVGGEGCQVQYSGDFPTLETAVAPFELVFRNLIANSIKYHEEGKPSIEIEVSEANEHFRFWISDDGPGIQAKDQKKLFQPFTTFSKDAGHGLGLALVRRAVNAVGGQVEYQASDSGGAKFCFSWPKEEQLLKRLGSQHSEEPIE